MLTKAEIFILCEAAQKHSVSEVYLFGSPLDTDKDYKDIDIAIKGIESKLFFKFFGGLMRDLKKPVDVIDLSSDASFNELIEDVDVRIYG